MKIQTKISIIIFVLILITGIVSSTTSYIISKQMLEHEIHHHLKSIATSKTQHVETVINNNIKLVVKTLATSKLFKDALINQNIMLAKQRIKNLIYIYDEISRIRVLDKHGKMVVSGYSKTDHVGNAEIFINGKEKSYIRDAHLSTMTGTKVISISAPILIKGKFSGIIIVNIEMKAELYKITKHRHGRSGEVYLINRDGYMITPSRFMDDTFLKLKINTLEAKTCLAMSIEEHKTKRIKIHRYQDYRGKSVLGTHSYIDKTGWCLLAEIDAEEAYAPVHRLVRLMTLFFIILLVVSGVITFFTSRKITNPILKLHHRAREIEQGNWNYQVTIETQDEIGQFSRTFDSMTTQLKHAQDKLQDYQQHLKKLVKERTRELTAANEQLQQEIEERIQTSNALHATEEQVSLLLNSTAEAIFGMDITGCCTFCNPACVKILGYNSVDDMITQDIHSMIHHSKQDGSPFSEKNCLVYQSIKLGKEIHSNNEIFWRADHTYFPVECWSHPIFHKGGIIGAVVTFIDITKRKQAELALQKSEEKHRRLVENMPDEFFFYSHDTDGIFTFLSDSIQNTLGYTPTEFMNHYLTYLTDNPINKKVQYHSERSIQGIIQPLYETEIYCKDGAIKFLEVSETPIFNEQGNVIAVEGIAHDMTERKQVEENIKKQARLLDLIFANSLDSLVLLDKDYNFIRVSETYAKACQRDSSEFPGHNHFEFYPSNLKDEFDAAAKNKKIYQRTARPFIFPEHPEWDTTYWDLSLVPIQDITGEIELFLFTLKDVTDLKQAEAKIQKERDKLLNIFNAIPDGIYIVNKQFDIEYVNPVLIQEFGPVNGSKCYEYFHARTEVCSWCKNDKVFAGETVRWEFYVSQHNKYYDLLDTPIQNVDGSISKFEIFHDVTEHKLTEKKLICSEQRYRRLFNDNKAIELLIDPTNGKI
ncbi:PAS domain S-box protein [Thiotrichales bacterium HSG1]|nr:PAS domain S-box protein [Thiotrichales bacterium HSG1]